MKRSRVSTVAVVVAAVVFMAGFWVISGSAQEPNVIPPAAGLTTMATVGQCAMPTKMRYKTNTGGITTTSMSYQKVMDDSIIVGAPGCVIVHFQGTLTGTPGESVYLRALVDAGGSPMNGAIVLWQPTVEIGYRYVAIDFVIPNVAAGARTVQIQWWTANGKSMTIYNRHMITYYP